MKFTAKQNKEFWNNYSKKSKDNPFGAHSDKNIVELENQFIISELKSRKIFSLLDIGCGNGQRTILFSKHASVKTIGIDYSKEMIKEATHLLSKQKDEIKNKLSFELKDIQNFSNDILFDTIISCRSLINQPSWEHQVKVFETIYEMLNEDGSFIISEVSKEGISRLSTCRQKFGLDPTEIKWHNLPIEEKIVFSKINNLFKIENIKRLGTYYFISRIIHPSLVFPDEPQPDSKINDVARKAEEILRDEQKNNNNTLEDYGIALLVHFKKIS